MSIFWAEGPLRPHASPGPETWSCPADGKTYFVRLLGDPVPVWLHWHEGRKRTVPCAGIACALCPQVNQQWKGYTPALLFDAAEKAWKPRIVELTENARDELLTDDFRPIVQWRGTVVSLRRVGSKVTARVDDRPVAGELPPSWDVKPTLIRMWQIRQPVIPSKGDADDDGPHTIPFRRDAQ